MKFKEYIDINDNFRHILKLIHTDLFLKPFNVKGDIEGIIDFWTYVNTRSRF